ncbi:MAG: hypothetical protein ACRD2L_23875, partial [Terriglobia bacterium]
IYEAVQNGWLTGKLSSGLVVNLDSPEAAQLRQQYREAEEYEQRRIFVLYPPPEARVEKQLQRVEQGDTEAWIELAYELPLKPDSRFYETNGDSDLAMSYGWQSANQDTRERVLIAAQRYVLLETERSLDFLPTNNCPHWAMTEYKALLLLLQQGQWQGIAQAPDQVFRRWCIVALWYPFEQHARSRSGPLLRHLAAERPVVFADAVSELLSTVGRTDNCYTLATNLEETWSAAVEDMLLQHLRAGNLSKQSRMVLLERACRIGSSRIQALARGELDGLITDFDEARLDEAITLVDVLLSSSAGTAWPSIWGLIQKAPNIGRRVVEGIAYVGSHLNFTQSLSDDAIADLHIWLEKQYPQAEDPQHGGGAYSVGTRDMIADMRNRLLRVLDSRGAVTAIDRVIAEFPGHAWLKWHRNEARKVLLR